MPPQPWATPEQQAFLIGEDSEWLLTKAGSTTLKGFYTRTAMTFLQQWPMEPTAQMLEEAGDNVARVKELVEGEMVRVSREYNSPFSFNLHLSQRIANWYSNRHRQKKLTPTAPNSLLDLSGKHTRKKPPLQQWQAFSAIYYRPEDSPIRREVDALFNQRNDPAATAYLTSYLPSDTNMKTIKRLLFLSAFLRERCTRLSSEEHTKVHAYIQEQSLLAEEHRDKPWFLDEDYEDKPLLAENRFIQQ